MGQIIEVSVDKLQFWLENYRFGSCTNQDDALEKLSNTKNFIPLIASIREHGFQLNNLLTVSKDKQTSGMYLVYDGNRRLAAVKQMPEIKKLQVYEEDDEAALNAILSREHSKDATGQLHWTSVQQARWEKSVFDQLSETGSLPTNVQCLLILEEAKGEPLPSDFPLTNFERLYGSSGFTRHFGIDVSTDPVTIKKKAEIKHIIEDIQDKKINSRNINTSGNIQKYLQMALDGKPQEQRTNLADDNESDEEVEDSEEQSPTRLFTPSELTTLKKHIINPVLMHELEVAPVNKYPHLLLLATRAVLDTLRNIDQKEQSVPKAFGKNDVSLYMSNMPNKLIKKAEQLVDLLGEHAHNLNKKTTKSHIENSRELVNKLIGLISASIEKSK